MKLKAFGVILVIAAFTAVIAGCVAPTPVAPSVASTTSDQAAAGQSILGNVVYGSEPMAGARVDLRLPDWNATQNPDSTVASATAGTDGRYVIENPPVGDYSLVAVWPDGEDSEGGWPAVQISAGQVITDQMLRLMGRVDLLEPTSGEQINTNTPTLRWNPYADAAQYRVMIIDAGTTELVFDLVMPDTRLVAPPLPRERTYTWVVSAQDANGIDLAAADSIFTVAAPTTGQAPGKPAMASLP